MKLLMIIVLPFLFLSVNGQKADCSIYFNSGSFEPGFDELQRLKECADQFLKMNHASLKVIGYADTTSNWAFNWSLSQKRAKKIKSWLVVMGIPEEKIITDHKGESSSVSNQQGDRRTDLFFQSKELTLKEIFSEQDADVQYYTVDPLKENEFKCEKGTVIQIPKDCFVDAEGNTIKTTINFQVQEYYNLGDYIKKGLFTTSQRIEKGHGDLKTFGNAELLQSGGVVNINATNKGKKVYFNKGMKIGIGFNAKADDRMMAFMGTETEKGVNWFEDLLSKTPGKGLRGNEIWVKDSVIMYESIEKGKQILIDTNAVKEKSINTYRFIDRKLPAVYVDGFGMINCDKFWNDPTAKEMKMDFVLSNFMDDPETSVYMIFQKTMSVLPVRKTANEKGQILFSTSVMKMPYGSKAHVVAVNKKGDNFYLGAEQFDLKGDQAIKVEFYKATLQDITEFLSKYSMN